MRKGTKKDMRSPEKKGSSVQEIVFPTPTVTFKFRSKAASLTSRSVSKLSRFKKNVTVGGRIDVLAGAEQFTNARLHGRNQTKSFGQE